MQENTALLLPHLNFADNIDINKSTVSKETTINFFQLLNWGLYLMPLSAARMGLIVSLLCLYWFIYAPFH
jgi:hypothetical protein